jgi:small subunit ribosomal protein S17
MPKKQLIGEVVSNKMQKTVVVKVEKLKKHPKYQKRFKIHKKYKAHNENIELNVGDKVLIEESRPLSKEKRWVVIKKI